MAFVVYKPRLQKTSTAKQQKPMVTLSSSSIVLNKLARQIVNSEKLELAYEEETKRIRICPGNGENSVPLRKTKITSRGFFNEFDITSKGKYEIDNYDVERQTLYVHL